MWGDELDDPLDDVELGEHESALLGDRLPGISAADFEAAKAAFVAVEGPADGIGPIFNEAGCGNCHDAGATGGSGDEIERRFGRFVNGRFDPLANLGGSLRQLQTIAAFPFEGRVCRVPLEQEPAAATVRNVGRRTTPLFGLGLVDAMPNGFFFQLAAAQPAAIRGTVHVVPIAMADVRDPAQSPGGTRVGRFGWKAGVPSLLQFSADAYVNEMGITTTSCIRGVVNTAFARENLPNNRPSDPGCPDDVVPGVDDKFVGACTAGRTIIQEDVELFATFMTFLAPPARTNVGDPAVARGSALFDQVGCAGCHVRTVFRTPAAPFNGVPGNYAFRPFGDFLLHDMGALGDQIGDAGETVAQTRRMRTAPLWGARFNARFLHDGRAVTVRGAVAAHDGQAAAARAAFQALSFSSQVDVERFVLSL